MDKKQKWLKVLEYSLPALITIAVFVLAMIIKGIFPFGKNNLGYIDYNEQLVPFYTNLNDIFHGKANIFVDFNLGGGGSIITTFFLNGYLSPIDWLIALFPRTDVMFAVAFLIIIKLALMATTAYLCFKYFFKNTSKWTLLLFSLVWTYSGWTLVHFTNIGWLDLMILLPLLIMSAKPLIEKGKNLWFVLTLTYMLCLSYYISYMVLVGIVVIALYYIIFLASEKKKVASHLFFAIIISILMSFVAFIPSCLTSLQAHRFANTSAETLSSMFSYFFSKVIVVFMYALPFVFFVRLMFKIKEDKKTVLFFLVTFITLSIGILIEPINKMWHTGSYQCFPLRYGFVIIMFAIFGALYYIDKYMTAPKEVAINEKRESRIKMFQLTLCPALVMCLVVLFIASIDISVSAHPYRPVHITQFMITFAIFALTYTLIELFLRLKISKLKLGELCGGVLIFVLVTAQILCGAIAFVGEPGYKNTSRISNALALDLSELDASYKIKDREALYNSNFAELTRFPSLQTWIHISSEEQFQGYDALGINTNHSILLSSGGTIMTDIMLDNKYVLSSEELDSAYYTKIGQFNYCDEVVNLNDDKTDVTIDDINFDVYLYELNFTMYEVLTTNVDLNEVFSKDATYFERQNELYKALYGKSDDILKTQDLNISEDDDYFTISANALPVGQIAYISVKNQIVDGIITESGVMGRVLARGINDLGVLKTSSLEIKVPKSFNSMINIDTLKENLELATFDIATFRQVHESATFNSASLEIKDRTLEVKVDNAQGLKYAFIPFTYLNHMTAEINGESAKVTPTFSGFMSVELAEGENNIVIGYEPQYLKLCLIISIVALLIFIVFAILNAKFDLANKKPIVWIGFIGACAILLAVGVLVYLKPFFTFFVTLFKG